MKTVLAWKSGCLALLLSVAAAGSLRAQAQQHLPKTTDIAEDVSPDGSVGLVYQMTFDAAPWHAWKAMVGDEPSRLRAMMRHRFAALTFDDFKLELDDTNRVATMRLHSPTGPDLRDDGSYQVPVDGNFRLINNAGRVWYFSGNNPQAGNTLNNVKVTLPANAVNAAVINPNNAEQALTFALPPAPSPRRRSVGARAGTGSGGFAVASATGAAPGH